MKDTFSKADTMAVKGVAILFMLFAHLFNRLQLVDLSMPLAYVGEQPLVYLLIFAMNPVHFFIFLSGYGLSLSNKNGKDKRCLRLYLHYWLTLFLFVPLGCILGDSQVYPGNFITILKNIAAWDNSYNHETWFMLPYALLVLTAPFIFRQIDRRGYKWILSLSFFIYLLVRLASRWDGKWLDEYRLLFWIDSYFTLLLPFLLGAASAQRFPLSRLRERVPTWVPIIGLPLLMIGIILVRNTYQSIFYPFYVTAFILLFVCIKRPAWLDRCLNAFGRRSTSMWLVHTYFCYYLFQDFIYGFKYPLLIFLVLLCISYFVAVVIDRLNTFLQRHLSL